MSDVKERIEIKGCKTQARASFRGQVLAESDRALVLHEKGYPPRIYFPKSDTRMPLAQISAHKTHCPYKGDAAYWSFSIDGETLENVAWGYPEPLPNVAAIADHISFADPVAVES